jgi:hypothetical protein
MSERATVAHPNNYLGWDEDIVAAAVNAAGLVVSEEDRLNPALTNSDASARGQRVGIMAKAILAELAKR